jgi:hypothetical protein
VDLLGLRGGSDLAGADGPDGLVGDDNVPVSLVVVNTKGENRNGEKGERKQESVSARSCQAHEHDA